MPGDNNRYIFMPNELNNKNFNGTNMCTKCSELLEFQPQLVPNLLDYFVNKHNSHIILVAKQIENSNIYDLQVLMLIDQS